MNQVRLQRLSEEYFLMTHSDGTWEIIHGDRISTLHQPQPLAAWSNLKDKERRQMLPTFVWSGDDIDRLEQWWSNRIEQLIAMKQPLAASALFDEFQLEQRSNFTHPDWLLIHWIAGCLIDDSGKTLRRRQKKGSINFLRQFLRGNWSTFLE